MPFGEKKSIIEVDYHEINELVKSHYGHNFSCVADQEWGNDQSHSLRLEEEALDTWAAKKVEQFQATGKGNGVLYALLQDLVNRKVIEPGNYLINVCW